MLRRMALLIGMLAAATHANATPDFDRERFLNLPDYVDAGGREWLDLNQTREHSWYELATSCSVATGNCSGNLPRQGGPDAGSIGLDGYTWATRDEVRELFYEIAGLPAGALDSYYAIFPGDAGYGANALSKMEFTIGFDSVLILNGYTRTVDYAADTGITAYLATATGPGLDPATNNVPNQFNLTSQVELDFRDSSVGAYLYRRAPVAVPEPGSWVLFAPALVFFALGRYARYRRRSTSTF